MIRVYPRGTGSKGAMPGTVRVLFPIANRREAVHVAVPDTYLGGGLLVSGIPFLVTDRAIPMDLITNKTGYLPA